MILNSRIRETVSELTDELYRIYYLQLLNGEISCDDEYYFIILNDTIKYFCRIEEYEKCVELEKLK